MSNIRRRMLQLHHNSINRTEPSLRETEAALCETLLAGQGADLEGIVTFPH